jgi:hypothetical protein
MKQHDFYLTSPIKFARPGGDVGESTLIVLSEPMYKHAGAAAALKGCYTQAMLQMRDRVTQKAEEAKSETKPTVDEKADFIRMVICSDSALSEPIINAFIRLVKMPGVAAVDGDIQLSDVHLNSIPYGEVERMATRFLAVFIDQFISTEETA